MMKLCEYRPCGQWAQWRGVWPDKTIHLLCRTHKDEFQRLNGTVAEPIVVKFVFVGAVPEVAIGTYNS